jgi:hypothetical protein
MTAGSPTTRKLRWLTALYLALLLAQLALRAPEVPWTVDNGIKWLVSAHGEDGLRGSLPYAGRALDPELRNYPIAAPFARAIDGRAVAQYPPTFSLLARPFVRALGAWGGSVLPLLGALLAALGAARLARKWSEGAAIWAFLFAGPLGPLAWYGTQLWEHTLVAACVVWAAAAWPVRGRAPAISALLLALGTWMREETLIFVPAFVAGALASRWRAAEGAARERNHPWRDLATFASVYAAALVPFLALQRWITGSVLGFHFSGNLGGSLGEILLDGRAEVVRGLLWSGPKGATGAIEIGLTFAAAACVLATRFLGARWRAQGYTVACALMGAAAVECAIALAASRGLPMVLIHTSGLLLFAPWVLAALAGSNERAASLKCCAALAVASLLLVTPSITAFALHWGPRVLLSALPLLAATAALGMARMQVGADGALPLLGRALLVASCLALQVYGGWVQARVTRGAAEQLEQTRNFLAQTGTTHDPLVTSEWWYGATYAPLLAQRPVFLARSSSELQDWIARLRATGGRRFFWASAAQSDALLQGLGVRALRSAAIAGYPPAYRHRLFELELD